MNPFVQKDQQKQKMLQQQQQQQKQGQQHVQPPAPPQATGAKKPTASKVGELGVETGLPSVLAGGQRVAREKERILNAHKYALLLDVVQLAERVVEAAQSQGDKPILLADEDEVHLSDKACHRKWGAG